MKRWTYVDANRSIQNASCLICKKQKTAKESEITLCFSSIEHISRSIVCNQCFEKDILVLNDFNKDETECGVCFICDENFEKLIRQDASRTTDTYTFEMFIEQYSRCVHFHKECFEGNVSDEWLFDGE